MTLCVQQLHQKCPFWLAFAEISSEHVPMCQPFKELVKAFASNYFHQRGKQWKCCTYSDCQELLPSAINNRNATIDWNARRKLSFESWLNIQQGLNMTITWHNLSPLFTNKQSKRRHIVQNTFSEPDGQSGRHASRQRSPKTYKEKYSIYAFPSYGLCPFPQCTVFAPSAPPSSRHYSQIFLRGILEGWLILVL